MTRVRLFMLSFVLAGLTAVSSDAVSTATFGASTFEELDKGEPKGALISSEGEVVPGRSATRVKSVSAMVFASARGSDGTVYFGTGDDGQLLAVRGGQVRKVADLKAVLITSLVQGPGDSLLAATMPDARVLRIDPRTGRWTQLASLPTSHVWALLHDRAARRIYAATGSPGKIFTIAEGGGAPQMYYDPGEKHLLCLARTPRGSLLTGSSDKAVLYEVTGKGRGRAVHDFDATELRDVVAAADGAIFVAVNKFTRKTSGLPRFDRSKDGEEGTAVKSAKKKSGEQPKVRTQELRPGAKEGKGAIYRVDLDGNAEQMLDLDKGYFTDLELDPSGVLWAGDGTKGKVYLIHRDRTVFTAFDLAERQVLALAVGGTEQYIGTGDAGAIYRIAPGTDPRAKYLSEVFDAKFPARWGNLTMQASPNLKLESRSGNTVKPDSTWSGWQGAGPRVGASSQLRSAAGRYLQLQFTLPGGSVLRSFTAYYRPTNQRARVTEIELDDSDRKDPKKPRTAKIKLKWKVDNSDSDTLVYRVFAREEMGLSWRKISGQDALDKAEFEWDTEPVPDGFYRLKVVASDEPSNGPASTLTGSRVTARVLVDNRKPEILGLVARYPWCSGMAKDSYSTITRIEYSVDGQPWRLVDPTDGIYDSPAESFRFQLPALTGGRHIVAVRALDGAANMGVAQVGLVR